MSENEVTRVVHLVSKELIAPLELVPDLESVMVMESDLGMDLQFEDEPMVDLGNDYEEYPEMELSDEERVNSKEAQIELEVESIEEELKSAAEAANEQLINEVQDLKHKVFLFEEIWERERLFNDQLEKGVK